MEIFVKADIQIIKPLANATAYIVITALYCAKVKLSPPELRKILLLDNLKCYGIF